MKYITVSDLSDTIRKNIWKIPRDIDFVVGVPRSGMIAASLISSYLNMPLTDVNSFIAGMQPCGGKRLDYFKNKHTSQNKVLVVDDTVFAGTSMTSVRKQLSAVTDTNIIYMCVYLEGTGEKCVDLYLEDVRKYTNAENRIVLYEWNILQHHTGFMSKCLFDVDGVFCVEPPDERKENEYIEYIKNATPLFIPRTHIGGIITYRLEKNRTITEQWLKKNGITYNELMMFQANTWDERNKSGIASWQYKGDFYKTHNNYRLFVESSDQQAKMICKIAKKPVYCVETNKLYQ